MYIYYIDIPVYVRIPTYSSDDVDYDDDEANFTLKQKHSYF